MHSHVSLLRPARRGPSAPSVPSTSHMWCSLRNSSFEGCRCRRTSVKQLSRHYNDYTRMIY
ncbi:uncharacterized protein C8R40DRAFT_1106210 [Lentinula edodes]|uniref:uncharacterized protein n=1 Tax=Lentinula edodes TaxID=5353 RepID=UPI001E8CF312|nr:uncharacterized protein C8R40DRAFT_1137074 [Lentinula edodes]XP_046086007.1 uncharacterized protein C8R40DRAFT_1106210 [Lentinula edodes]KAH7867835.1 hypothetical protein C8R40DRAFT_1137074 [Lentinula edodes]KAH7874913.1 hypothetical protein C8R40DRAFT_1106210 [Lentinula edodes]